jgi:predicted DNA-binding antitoxin AbrB/MazE fold protein
MLGFGYNRSMLIVGEARYANGMLVLPTPLDWEEGTKFIVAKVEGVYVLIPASSDVNADVLMHVEASIREHQKTLEALAQ